MIENSIDIKTISLYDDFLFIKWLENNKPRGSTEKNLFLKMLSSSYKPIVIPEYIYQGTECKGLGYALQNKLISISFNTMNKWNQCFIRIKEFNIKNDKFIKLGDFDVKHLSSELHIKCHKRIFKHHKKHNPHNPDRNESPLLYNTDNKNDIKRINNLLNCAVPIRKNAKRLCFYDKNKDKYIIFPVESKKTNTVYHNVYHAFHIEKDNDKIPQKTKKLIAKIIS